MLYCLGEGFACFVSWPDCLCSKRRSAASREDGFVVAHALRARDGIPLLALASSALVWFIYLFRSLSFPFFPHPASDNPALSWLFCLTRLHWPPCVGLTVGLTVGMGCLRVCGRGEKWVGEGEMDRGRLHSFYVARGSGSDVKRYIYMYHTSMLSLNNAMSCWTAVMNAHPVLCKSNPRQSPTPESPGEKGGGMRNRNNAARNARQESGKVDPRDQDLRGEETEKRRGETRRPRQ